MDRIEPAAAPAPAILISRLDVYLSANMKCGEVENCGESVRGAGRTARAASNSPFAQIPDTFDGENTSNFTKLKRSGGENRSDETALDHLMANVRMAQRILTDSVLEFERKVLRSRVSAPNDHGSCGANVAHTTQIWRIFQAVRASTNTK